MPSPVAPAAPSRPALPWLAAAAVMLLWASSFIVIRFSGAHLSPGAMTLLRMVTAAAVMLPLVLTGRVRTPRSGRMWAGVLAWGVTWFCVYSVVLNASELFLDPATAAMLVNLAPLIVAVAAGGLVGAGGSPPRRGGGGLARGGGARQPRGRARRPPRPTAALRADVGTRRRGRTARRARSVC